jgi:outer membrane protein TolC
LGVARAAGRPSVTGFADARASGTGGERGFRDNDATLGLDIAYDVDLFGAVGAGRRAALARLAASRFDRDAVALAVEGDVARAFVGHAALSARIGVLQRALGNAREFERIVGVRVREGVATRVDSGLQAIEVRRIEAELSRLAEARARTGNALAILVGAGGADFRRQPSRSRHADPAGVRPRAACCSASPPPGRPRGRSADRRRRRAMSPARARRSCRPCASRPGRCWARAAAGRWASRSTRGPACSRRSSTAGGCAARCSPPGARRRKRLRQYRRTMLVALGEAEDALTGVAQSRVRGELLAGTMTVARTTARLARRQYVEGAADLQTVLDAERRALDVEDAAAVAAEDRLDAAIDLYRALGGSPAA